MAGVASALIVLVTILKLGPLFQDLPKVCCYFNASVNYEMTTVKTNGATHPHFDRIDEAFYNVRFRLSFHRLSL